MAFNALFSLLRSQIEQKDRIERLLYNFQEPFDKKRALKDWNYGDKAKLTSVQLIYFQKLLLEYIIKVLNTCFSPYKSYADNFVQPTEQLAKQYYYCNRYIKDIEAHPQFPLANLYRINLQSFYAIKGDDNRLIKDWYDQQGALKDHLEKLNNFLLANESKEYPIPFRLEHFLLSLKQSIQGQKELQEKQNRKRIPKEGNIAVTLLPEDFQWDKDNPFLYHFGTFGLMYISGNRYELFKMLSDKNGDWETVTEMKEITGNQTRTILNQIDERVREATNDKVGIIPRKTGVGAYRVALLNK